MNKRDGQHVSLDEFLAKDLGSLIGRDLPMDVEKILGQVNGGSFMKCHTAIFEATGIWIDELVPVFQRLDAALGLADRRPDFARD